MNRLLLAVAALLVSGCGGGGDSSPSAAPVAAAPLVIVAAYGDSTQGANHSDGAPPAVAGRALAGKATVINEGENGSHTLRLLYGLDMYPHPWTTEMATSPAQIVTIKLGINDFAITPSAYAANIRLLVAQAKAAGKRVMLETPSPVLPAGASVLEIAYSVPDFEARVLALRAVAAETSTPLCDHYTAIRSAGRDTLANIPDGFHPNAALYDLIGAQLAQCLLPLL